MRHVLADVIVLRSFNKAEHGKVLRDAALIPALGEKDNERKRIRIMSARGGGGEGGRGNKNKTRVDDSFLYRRQPSFPFEEEEETPETLVRIVDHIPPPNYVHFVIVSHSPICFS